MTSCRQKYVIIAQQRHYLFQVRSLVQKPRPRRLAPALPLKQFACLQSPVNPMRLQLVIYFSSIVLSRGSQLSTLRAFWRTTSKAACFYTVHSGWGIALSFEVYADLQMLDHNGRCNNTAQLLPELWSPRGSWITHAQVARNQWGDLLNCMLGYDWNTVNPIVQSYAPPGEHYKFKITLQKSHPGISASRMCTVIVQLRR